MHYIDYNDNYSTHSDTLNFQSADNSNLLALYTLGIHISLLILQEESSPLHLAVMGGHHEVAIALINGGTDVDAGNKHNQTALHYAVLSAYHYDDITVYDCNCLSSTNINLSVLAACTTNTSL